jgi:hypothetical protein
MKRAPFQLVDRRDTNARLSGLGHHTANCLSVTRTSTIIALDVGSRLNREVPGRVVGSVVQFNSIPAISHPPSHGRWAPSTPM